MQKNQRAPTTDHANDYVFFWKSGSPFSNWHPAKYTYDGIEFNCSEQGLMWSKAMLFDDVDVANSHYDRLVESGWDHINMFRQWATVRLMHGILLSDRTLVRHQHSNVTIGAVA